MSSQIPSMGATLYRPCVGNSQSSPKQLCLARRDSTNLSQCARHRQKITQCPLCMTAEAFPINTLSLKCQLLRDELLWGQHLDLRLPPGNGLRVHEIRPVRCARPQLRRYTCIFRLCKDLSVAVAKLLYVCVNADITSKDILQNANSMGRNATSCRQSRWESHWGFSIGTTACIS